MTKKNKRFDAVAESRKWRVKTGALLATMTPKEQIAFLNRHLERFRAAPKKGQAAVASS